VTTMRLQRAQLLYNQGRYQQAEQEAGLALAEDPEDPAAHVILSLCLLQLDRYDEAAEHARQAVALRPDAGATHATLARVWIVRNYLDKAHAAIGEALALEPDEPDHHALLGRIELLRRRWEPALAAAEAALALAPEHVDALNLRAEALRMLGRTGAAEEELLSALRVRAEDPWTHNNLGWNCLERGDRKKAMEHFREALRLDPDLESARAGVVETLRAHNVAYRLLMKYFFFMQRLASRAQWMVVLGAYLLYRVVLAVARSHPELQPWLMPVIVAYIVMVLATWLGRPLMNLALRLHPFGRLALSDDERTASNWIGGSLAAGIAAGIAALVYSGPFPLLAGFFLLMVFPLAATFQAARPWPRKPLAIYTAALALLGIVAVVTDSLAAGPFGGPPDGPPGALDPISQIAVMGFVLGAVLSTWVGNLLNSVSWKR